MPVSPPSTNLVLWLKADAGSYKDAGSTLCADGDTCQQWNDQSGNGWNFSQATSGNRPTYKAGILNGLPVLRFDHSSSNSMASLASITHGIGTGDFWFAAVHSPRTVITGYSTVFSIGTYSPAFYLPGPTSAGPNVYLGGNHYFSTVMTAQFYLQEFARVSGTLKTWVSTGGAAPVLDGTTFSLSTSISDATCYAGTDNGGDPTNSDIGELLLYSSSLNSTDQGTLESYLRNKWWGVGSGGLLIPNHLDGLGSASLHKRLE
jgi:hypothetical protein